MKLYDVPRNTWVILGGKPVFLYSIDGMYSLCRTEEGRTFHPAAWSEVEVMNPQPEKPDANTPFDKGATGQADFIGEVGHPPQLLLPIHTNRLGESLPRTQEIPRWNQ